MCAAVHYIDVHTEAGHMKQGKDIVESRLHLGELKDDIQIPYVQCMHGYTYTSQYMLMHIMKSIQL